jgi:hypothetical protein
MLHLVGYTRILEYTYDARTINVKSPNNTSKWQMGFNSAFKGLNSALRRGWVLNTTPRSLYHRERNSVPKVQKLGGPHGRSGRVRKTSPLPGFDPRTVHPVACRYTD